MSSEVPTKNRQMAHHYQIVVQGALDQSWCDWLGGFQLTELIDGRGFSTTCLSGAVPDQSALRGILNTLWDLNIVLLSVKCEDYPSRR